MTVRGGGHNVAGSAVADGAIMVDLSCLRGVVFSNDGQRVQVGGGCVWGDVERPAADRDGVIPTGMISHTGVGGLTLGGGTGYLTRLLGTTADSLLAAHVVLADGTTALVDEESDPDLLWALRGAGHNFGVCTSLLFRVHRLATPVWVRQAIYPTTARREILCAYREWAQHQPDALTTYVHLLVAPPYWPWIPEQHRETEVVNITSVFYGSEREGALSTNEIFEAAAPIWTRAKTMRHVELQHACDDDWRPRVGHYWKPAYLADLPDSAVETILAWCDRYPPVFEQARSKISPQPINQFELNYRGGMLSRRASLETSYSDRTTPFNSNIQAVYSNPADEPALLEWADGFAAAMARYWSGAYGNFRSDPADSATGRRIYGDEKFDRLARLKTRYDPENVFWNSGLDLVTS